MFVGLDLGTSGVKALLLHEDGTVLGSADASLTVSRLHPGWSEQDPADWVQAACKVLTELSARHEHEMRGVKGIGLSGQMHGATLLDENGAVLRPCILWNDTRAHAEAAQLDAMPEVRRMSGNIVFPGFTAPKLAWLSEHEPEHFKRVAMVLLPKDYLTYWLTGEVVTDMSDAAGTSWLDVGERAWSPELLHAGGMDRDQMPALREGTDIAGPLRADLAAELGLDPNVLVIAGGADNAAAACGVGALRDGDGFVSLGTSGVLLAARDTYAPSPETAVHTFCHAVPDSWYQMGVILAGTDSLNWLAGVTGQSPAALTEALGDLRAPGAVRFLPYLSGERTPHNDSEIRGAFLNLDMATGQADLTRSVLEGVSFALCDCLNALRQTGATLPSLLAIGGGARSRYWTELLATVLDLPIELPRQGEFGAALGAARLAICGVTGAAPADVMLKPEIAETIDPLTEFSASYADAYGAFAASYPSLKAMP